MKNKPLLKKIIAITASLMGCFLIIFGSAALVYSIMYSASAPPQVASPIDIAGGNDVSHTGPVSTPPPSPVIPGLRPPDRTNIMLLGLDDEAGLPDVILLITYDGVENMIDIISIPRDTRVVLTDVERAELNALSRWFPSSGVVKINELHNYAGRANGPAFLRRRIETMLDIEVDYQVILDLAAFRYIVDAVGGIYMDIRPGGMVYRQGGMLDINIPGGRQLLDGELAEQFVRFRVYARGDLARIEAQHQFMREFFSQALSMESIMNNPMVFARSLFAYVATDFLVTDLLRYTAAIHALSADSIEFHTVPGEARMIGGISFFIVDEAAAKDLVDEIYAANVQQ